MSAEHPAVSDSSAAQPQRDPVCVERWPECESGAYDPRCCRFPKSCSCTSYPPDESPAATVECDAEYPSVYMGLDGVTRCRCVVCARCGHHTGNAHQGHYWSFCKQTGQLEGFHFCCPDLPCEYLEAT